MKKHFIALTLLIAISQTSSLFGQNTKELFITGTVTSVNIKGYGANSAELLFTILDTISKTEIPIMVTSEYEPQIFTSMSNFVTLACFNKVVITAGYTKKPNETEKAIEVYYPKKN